MDLTVSNVELSPSMRQRELPVAPSPPHLSDDEETELLRREQFMWDMCGYLVVKVSTPVARRVGIARAELPAAQGVMDATWLGAAHQHESRRRC